jgi:hypothetical protein
MKLTKLEALVIDETSDDYEDIELLARVKTEDMGRLVTEEEVEGVLRMAASAGLVDVFFYDRASQIYVKTAFDCGYSTGELQFYITDAGRRAVAENWNDEWSVE